MIQRRVDGFQSFYQNWTTYESGFGDLCRNFWWGNANIKAFTSSYYRLRVVLKTFDTDYVPAYVHRVYDEFKVTGSEYRLDLGNSIGGFNNEDGNSTGDLNAGGTLNLYLFSGVIMYSSCSYLIHLESFWAFRPAGSPHLHNLGYISIRFCLF